MSFTGILARKKGVQSPLKGVKFQSPISTQSLRKKHHHKDEMRKFSLVGYKENCNPNGATEKYTYDCQRSLHRSQKLPNRYEKNFKVSDGFQKSANGSEKTSKVSESGMHLCSSRKKGVQSTLGPKNRTVQFPATPQSLRKNQHHEDDIRRFSLFGFAENCNPNAGTVKSSKECRKSHPGPQKLPNGCEKIIKVSDGCQKSFNVQRKISDGFRKSTDASLKPSTKVSESGMQECTSRKFLVAKKIEKPNQESTVCKCCEKKSKPGSLDTFADTGSKCVCIASQKSRASQEFIEHNFSKTKKNSARVGETSVEIQIGVQEHTCGLSYIEDSKDGFSKMCGNSEKDWGVELEISTMNENMVDSEFSELCEGNIFSNDTLSTLGMSNGEENRLSIRTPDIIGISDPKNVNLNQTMHHLEGLGLDKSNISEDRNSNAIMLTSPQMNSNGNAEKIKTSEQGNGNLDEKTMGDATGYSNATLLSSPWKGVSPALRRPLQVEALDYTPECGGGTVKQLVEAFESLTSFSDYRTVVGPQAHYSHKKAVTSDKIMQDIVVEAEGVTRCPIIRTQSLDSTGQGSLDRSGIQQWKKQSKVTCARPFKLRTEQRGQKKEKEFLKKVQVMFSEEQKNRIPMAQGLPWTTDEPQRLVKPRVKEYTKPLDVKLYTEKRAIDRAEFDQITAEKINALEQKRMEEKRLQKLAEEEEIKRLRKEMIPRAQLLPFFYRPFIHRRSYKSPSIPKETKSHVLHHKRAKCIPCN